MEFEHKLDPKLSEVRMARGLVDILICYSGLAVSFLLYRSSIWFLPICFILSANRLFALSLISHEAVHFNLSRSRRLNDFIGRYFCAFPCFISLSKYRRLHLFHHRAVGVKDWDPDYGIYSPFPVGLGSYIKSQIADLVALRTLKKHIDYYTEWPEFRSTYLIRDRRRQLGGQSDFGRYCLSVITGGVALAWTGVWMDYLVIVTLPYLLIVQPYVLVVAGFQHGSDRELPEEVILRSRTIQDRTWLVRLLLPLDINYHAEHHMAPQVPHYNLRALSLDLEKRRKLWRQSFAESTREIFRTSNR